MTNLHEHVESDPDRNAMEKETAITMLGDEKVMTVMSAKKTIVKSLLRHDEFELEWASIQKDDGRERVEAPLGDDVEAVYAVSGKMPIGCLTVKSKPRSNNHQSSVVNAETIDADAFN